MNTEPIWRRSKSCIEQWPDCYSCGYNPSCCRFPKSCSCESPWVPGEDDSNLEPLPPAPAAQVQPAPQYVDLDLIHDDDCSGCHPQPALDCAAGVIQVRVDDATVEKVRVAIRAFVEQFGDVDYNPESDDVLVDDLARAVLQALTS